MTDGLADKRLSDALIKEIEERILKRLGSMAFLEYRYGTVAVVTGSYASAYLGGDTYASPNFRIPSGMTLGPTNAIRVVIDPRGDRYVSDKF